MLFQDCDKAFHETKIVFKIRQLIDPKGFVICFFNSCYNFLKSLFRLCKVSKFGNSRRVFVGCLAVSPKVFISILNKRLHYRGLMTPCV